jgi:hypothetical protein
LIVAIHQPQYLPWLGYFHKLISADVFCFLDNVQYKKNEWQNRNRIKTATGWQWLTVPVSYKFPQSVNEVTVNNQVNWQKKHLQALRTNYSRAPFFDEVMAALADGFEQQWSRLVDINIYFIQAICTYLGLEQKQLIRSSEVRLPEDPTGRLVEICRQKRADTYLSGADGARYMDLSQFETAGIRVVFQAFRTPAYPQQFNGFEPQLSIVDMLFNCGRQTVDLIKQANPD